MKKDKRLERKLKKKAAMKNLAETKDNVKSQKKKQKVGITQLYGWITKVLSVLSILLSNPW